jgi:hypothetical protein
MPTEDPKNKLTNWLTGGQREDKQNDDKDRTIINSKEQIEFYFYYTMVGEATGIPFFEQMARLDERLMMSFKGKRSEEVVQAMVGIDTQERIKAGLQPEKQRKPGMTDDHNL